MSTNFQASDNTAAPSTDAPPAITDNVMSDVGTSYLRDAKDLTSTGPSAAGNDTGTDAQNTINGGLGATDQLYNSTFNGTAGDARNSAESAEPTNESVSSSNVESERSLTRESSPPGRAEMSLARSAGGG